MVISHLDLRTKNYTFEVHLDAAPPLSALNAVSSAP
jgi:hypothetical protein